MEFDKSKVYTVFNADEVKIGSKGYFADTKEYLTSHVKFENKDFYCTLDEARHNSELPFMTNGCVYRYFYLVEEPKEKTKRPCTREELLEMLKKQGLPMLKSNLDGVNYVVTVITGTLCHVYDCGDYNYQGLCETFTLLDGTELWVEE